MKENKLCDINDAMELISSTLEIELENKETLPYFFIVGAGISVPEIPGAATITNSCIEKVKMRYSQNPARFDEIYQNSPGENLGSKNYSYWIEKAYPNRINRSNFFKSIIKDSKISTANILLAQIIQSKKIATTVFTTNFDNKLKQALELMGVSEVFVADNPLDNLSIDVSSSDIQIAHVHGSYQFYDCANLEYEISDVTEQNGLTGAVQALRSFLQSKAPIIVGYSGWETDVIMSCLRERIIYALPYNYIWLCYTIIDYYNLPSWLKDCPNIKFICEYERSNECNIELIGNKNLYNPKETDVATLPASVFLGRIIGKMHIDTPTIFVNPYLYYSEMLQKILPENEDVLHLKRWAERMRFLGQNISSTETKIQNLELASSRKDGKQIISCISNLANDSLLRTVDCEYIYKSIIKQVLLDKNIFFETDDGIELCQSFLLFIEKHKPELDSSNCTLEALLDVLFIRLIKRKGDKWLCIIDRIYALSKEHEELLEVSIIALGVKSSIINDRTESLNLLNQLLDMSSEHENEKNIAFIRCTALIEKALLVENLEDACEIWTQANELSFTLNSTQQKVYLLVTKSEIGSKIKDAGLSNQWLISALDGILSYSIEKYFSAYIQIISNVLSHVRKSTIPYNYLEEEIKQIIDATCNKESLFSDCEEMLKYAQMCNLYIEINNDYKITIKLGKVILQFEDKMPHKCIQYLYELSKMLSHLVSCPTIVVPNDIKARYLKKLKALSVNDTNIFHLYKDTLKMALIAGAEQDLKDVGLEQDLENVKACDELMTGYNAYSNNDSNTAEQIFLKLICYPSTEISDLARINLAYMVRRKESCVLSPSFFELLEPTDDKSAIKHMNIILHCLEKDNPEFESCKISYERLKKECNDVESALEWWENEEIVGAKESKVALIVLNSIIHRTTIDLQLELEIIDNEIYDVLLLKQILCIEENAEY